MHLVRNTQAKKLAMQNSIASFAAFLLLSLLLVSCASNKPSVTHPTLVGSNKVFVEAPDSLLYLTAEPSKDIAHESFLRGLLLHNTGHDQMAEPFYKRTLANEPGNRFLAFELVQILADNNKSKEALSIAQKAVRFEGSTNAEQNYLLARLYRENGKIDSCKAYYEKTIEASPTHFRALYEYSVILEMQQDFKNLSRIYELLIPMLNYPRQLVEKQMLLLKLRGNDSTLIDFMSQAYEAHPEAQMGKELVELLLEGKHTQQALDLAHIMVQEDPTNHDVLKFLVTVQSHSNQVDSAILTQRKLVALDSSDYDELEKLAILEFENNATDSAQSHFQQLLTLRASDHLAWFYLSAIAIIHNDPKTALDAIQRAIALKPDALSYRNQLASLYSQSGDFDKAQQILDAALEMHKDHPLTMQFKGNTYIQQALRLEDTAQAKSPAAIQARALREHALLWYNKSAKIDTLATDILFDLAADYERLDSVAQASQIFTHLLVLEPHNHQALNYFGYMLVDRKIDVEKGGCFIDSALAQSPKNEAYLDSKAWYYYRKSDFPHARELLNSLITIGSDDATIWEHMALVCDGMNDSTSALDAWKHVIKIKPNHAQALQRVKELEQLKDEAQEAK